MVRYRKREGLKFGLTVMFGILTVKDLLWLMNYLRNRINFDLFERFVYLISRGLLV